MYFFNSLFFPRALIIIILHIGNRIRTRNMRTPAFDITNHESLSFTFACNFILSHHTHDIEYIIYYYITVMSLGLKGDSFKKRLDIDFVTKIWYIVNLLLTSRTRIEIDF